MVNEDEAKSVRGFPITVHNLIILITAFPRLSPLINYDHQLKNYLKMHALKLNYALTLLTILLLINPARAVPTKVTSMFTANASTAM